MIPIKEVYDSVAKDYVNSAENGDLSFDTFNRVSKKMELRVMDYITGDIENLKPPAPYTSQKLKDYLSEFITKYPKNVEGGSILKPADYYVFENMYHVGDYKKNGCKDDTEAEDKYTTIDLLNTAAFNDRTKSNIVGLYPTFENPICKMVGNKFEFMPKDLGGVVLEYIRYPKFAKIVSKEDTEYNQLIIDEEKSTNYEYGDWAQELLVYFISRAFGISTREDSLLQRTSVVGKLVRDEK